MKVGRNELFVQSKTRPGISLHLSPCPGPMGRRTLSAAEEERARSYRFDADRQRFRQARSFLRHVLSIYTGESSSTLLIAEDHRGRPQLIGQDLDFNASRTDGMAIVAVSSLRIGVDVERVRPMDEMREIIEDHFTGSEQALLGTLSPKARTAGFFRLWTAKEAITKATGQGLTAPLGQIGFRLDGPRTVHVEGCDPYMPGQWWIGAFNLGPDLICTIAAEAAPSAIQLIRSDSCMGAGVSEYLKQPI